MDIKVLNNLYDMSTKSSNLASKEVTNNNQTFESLFNSALSMVNDTNNVIAAAEDAQMSYALGVNDSIHDLQVAQQKANLSLQYTMSVRNKVLEAYKEIMNLQF